MLQPKVETMIATAMMPRPGAAEDRLAGRRWRRGRPGRAGSADERQAEVGDVGQEVEGDDQAGARGERERDVAARVLHLAGGEGDVVPRVGGEERADLGDAEGDEQAERRRAVAGGGRDEGQSGLMVATPRGVQRSLKLAVTGARVAPTNTPIRMSATSDSVLAEVKTFWMSLPICRPRVLMNGQQHDDEDADELLGREAHGVVRREIDRRDDPGGRRDRRHEHAEVAGEGHRHGGDGAGLDHQEQRPAVEEAPERASRPRAGRRTGRPPRGIMAASSP